ncbi:class I SAM-dependent methyltransferase [Denitrobaculum tricleocarpae]|uniref:Class I SAM-dependent methyltransferase n=1 Tax=Denitrobaculum tricleocarpae TaxID=2591009 RepID=A0A545TFY9_9PROT|nr:class I SAM-dependent methyltransferase [Denitrobaculum tricleocarpae]TQV76096.1 class I SAM-dependent methyltransferase [Denitrobaculum tricleocarpae]
MTEHSISGHSPGADVPPLASDFAKVVLPELPTLPGMTSEPECRYLFWKSSSQLRGTGDVVEVGSWLGRSSIHIAAGLAASGKQTHLYCFDGFTWAWGDSNVVDLPLKKGDSFEEYFLKNVSAFADRITSQRTKIKDIEWTGKPIEFLFLDAPKKQPDLTHCLEVFGSSLVPGSATIAMQDYLYFPAYSLAVCCHQLADHLSLQQVVDGGSTVAFHVNGPLDFKKIKPGDWDIRHWSVAKVQAAWDEILAPLTGQSRERLEPGRALHLYDVGARQEALDAIKALPMTDFQRRNIKRLSTSHHYFSYPELFTAAGFPGTTRQNLLSIVKQLRDRLLRLTTAG